MPIGLKRVEVKNKFYEIAHFPGVVGLVDGTHIRIQRPSEIEADYINRRFYHSINVQAVCQPDGTFSDVWHVSLGLFTIQEFGRFKVLGCMLKISSQWGSIY